ncbi:MAG TPA: hypothetical protein VHB25_08310 [Gemmatimonadaceae bacterium]|nr:hypothetical protein [Gemmatimonadaceae bacterium]
MAAVAASGCAASAPHMFGQYPPLSPKIAATKGERRPVHLTVSLTEPANVAVFLVIPGSGSLLLYPADSTDSMHMEAGSHEITTSQAKLMLSDSMRLARRPTQQRSSGQRRSGTIGRDSLPSLGFNQHGYLLLFATPQPLSYDALAHRVSGLSIPIDDDDALNTVTKLIRETNHITGQWAGYATDFPP